MMISTAVKTTIATGLFLILAVFAVYPAAAQENDSQPAVQQMRVQILPEYDDPRVLVIAQGRLDVPGGEYNGPVTFRIPAGAQINQMAVMDLDIGGPQFQPYETQVDPTDSSWQLVTYTLDNPHFFYEYYYDLPGSGSQKQFTFTLNNPEAIGVLSMEIQQPLKAESFSLDPSASTSRDDPSGFTFWQLPDRAVKAGEVVEIQVRYTKSDPNPSVAREMTTGVASSSGGSTAVSEPEITEPPSWVGLTVIGVALVLGAGFMRNRIRSHQATATPKAAAAVPIRENRFVPSPVMQTEVGNDTVVRLTAQPKFCTQCGNSISANARFCPYCGEAVKKS